MFTRCCSLSAAEEIKVEQNRQESERWGGKEGKNGEVGVERDQRIPLSI